MSVVLEHEDGWIIDHEALINKLYSNLKMSCGSPCIIDRNCFSIHFPFFMNSQLDKHIHSAVGQLISAQQVIDTIRINESIKSKKRKRNLSKVADEKYGDDNINIQQRIQMVAEKIIEIGSKRNVFREPPSELESVKNPEARTFSQKVKALGSKIDKLMFPGDTKLYSTLIKEHENLKFINCNYAEYSGREPCIIEIEKEHFILPPNCCIINSDIKDFPELITLGKKMFDFIVIDPPWSNKSVKRKCGYDLLSNEEIKSLPIKELANDGAIIVVWVTNKQHHMSYVEDELFPAWNVKFCALWHWLKVCTSSEVICGWDAQNKRPFEHLYIGQKPGPSEFKVLNVDNHKLIISVPSAVSSHKPPLIELFQNYVKTNGNCLELFARNLLPNWTSWGNQVLLLQHVDLYAKA